MQRCSIPTAAIGKACSRSTNSAHPVALLSTEKRCRFLADAGSCPGNCSGMEETTGAPSSFAVYRPRRLRASSRDGGDGVNQPPSTSTMLLSRHTRRRELLCSIAGVTIIWAGPVMAQPADQVRRIGIFHAYEEADPEERAQISAFPGRAFYA